MDAGLNDRPPMPTDWSSVADFLALYNNNVSVNICYILGNSPSASGPSAGTTGPPPALESRT